MLSTNIVRFYRGWKAWSLQNESWEQSKWILINDLAEQSIGEDTFGSKNEIISRLEELIHITRNLPPDRKFDADIAKVTLQRLNQSYAYIAGDGNQVPNETSVKERGLFWEDVPEDYLIDLKLSLETSGGSANEVMSIEVVERKVAEIANRYLKHLKAEHTWIEYPTYSTSVTASKSAWTNMVTTENGNIQLISNSTSSKAYNRDLVNYLGLHEICGHVLHFSLLMKMGLKRSEFPHLYCISIHTMDTFFIEGIAQFMSTYLAERFSTDKEELNSIRSINLFFAVRHSNLMKYFSKEITFTSLIQRHFDYLGGNEEAISTQYQQIINNSFFSFQALCFFPSQNILRKIKNTNHSKFDSFLKNLLTIPQSPQSMKALVTEYIS